MSDFLYKKAFLYAQAADNSLIYAQIKPIANLFRQTYAGAIKAVTEILKQEKYKSNKTLLNILATLSKYEYLCGNLLAVDKNRVTIASDYLEKTIHSLMFFTTQSNTGSGFEPTTLLKFNTFYSLSEFLTQCNSLLEKIKKLSVNLQNEDKAPKMYDDTETLGFN